MFSPRLLANNGTASAFHGKFNSVGYAMSSRSLAFAVLLGGSVLAVGPALGQSYPAPGPYGYESGQRPARGYDRVPAYGDPSDDDDYDAAPRVRAGRNAAARDQAYDRFGDDDDLDLQAPGALSDPVGRGGAGVAPRSQHGVRLAALPPDADPNYSTRTGDDSEVDLSQTDRHLIADPTGEQAGTITINTRERKLYLSLGAGRAVEYGVGVGREGFLWKGAAVIGRKAFWPGWTPPSDMLLRRPDLPKHMEGGMDNPLGARAMYLFKGNKDTMFRIHGTNEPKTIGHAVSSGCIRMNNADVIDLYSRVQKGAKVVVI